MPIYEYQCTNCSHEFETIQKISEDPLKTCPECQQDALRKKISAAGFRLKGGGWYETDFKKDGRKNVSADDKSGASDSGGTKSDNSASKSDSGGAAGGTKTDGSKKDSSAGSTTSSSSPKSSSSS